MPPFPLLPLCVTLLGLATANNSFLGFFLLTSDEQEAPPKGHTSLRLTSLLQAAGFTKLPKPSQNCSISMCEPICLSKALWADRRDRDHFRIALSSSTWFCLTIYPTLSVLSFVQKSGGDIKAVRIENIPGLSVPWGKKFNHA